MILCHCIQFFGKEEYGLQKILVNLINLSTFSGFMFCFGYTNQVAYYEKSWKSSSVKMLRNVFRILIAFYISGIAYVAFVEGKIFCWKFVTEVLLLKKYPGWSEFLASFAAVLLVGIFIYPLMRRMNTIMFVGVACISCMACYIPYDRVHNSWLALLAGSRDYITFPVLQYAVFFAAGVLFCKKEIRWNVWIFLVVIFAGIPCLRTILETGMLPERFPPSKRGDGTGIWILSDIHRNREKKRFVYYRKNCSLSGRNRKGIVVLASFKQSVHICTCGI